MHRPIHHHAYVERAYGATCDLLEAGAAEIVEAATQASAAFAADLAGYLEKQLGFFDQDERVQVVVGDLDRSPNGAVLPLEWRADESRRLLPNVDAAIHITPIISTGSGATTELTLRGSYSPPRARHRGLIEHALARRVVDATLHTFLRHLVEELERRPAAA
jgi:hypothetical protein